MWRVLKLLVGLIFFLPAILVFISTIFFDPIGMTETESFRGKIGIIGFAGVFAAIGFYLIYRGVKNSVPAGEYPRSIAYRMSLDDGHVTYKYRTIFQYLLVVPLGLGFLGGTIAQNTSILVIVCGYILIYGAAVSLTAYPVHKFISECSKGAGVSVSGSKWSFSNPLTVTCSHYSTQLGI